MFSLPCIKTKKECGKNDPKDGQEGYDNHKRKGRGLKGGDRFGDVRVEWFGSSLMNIS